MNDDIVKDALNELQSYGESEALEVADAAELSKLVTNVELPGELQEEKNESIDPNLLKSMVKEGADSVDVRTMLRDMKFPQKIKLALFGNAACRGILILDANKLIQLCVLKNSKLVDKEIVDFSRNSNLSQVVLRAISEKREWMKSYDIKYNIVTNPKTPGDIALKWLRYLQFGDIKEISRSKNVPQVVSASARKKVVDVEEQKRKGGG